MRKKILIVDDDEINRDLIGRSLEKEPVEIFMASGGAEALKLAKEIRPHMLILDIMMPEKTGYEVCDEIKKADETRDAFVLFLSARFSETSKRVAMARGGDDIMEKPFSPRELRDKVREILKI